MPATLYTEIRALPVLRTAYALQTIKNETTAIGYDRDGLAKALKRATNRVTCIHRIDDWLPRRRRAATPQQCTLNTISQIARKVRKRWTMGHVAAKINEIGIASGCTRTPVLARCKMSVGMACCRADRK